MKQEQDIWVPITEVEPSDLFECSYGGSFARNLQLNQRLLTTFLDIVSLDGRFLLKDSTVKKPRVIPEINPDGSVAGKKGLRWGEKICKDETGKNPYFQLEADNAGWVASINGGLILDDLVEKGLSAREAQRPFAGKFNSLLRESLQKALLKDKCTFTGDPFLIPRIGGTGIIAMGYYNLITDLGFFSSLWVMINIGALHSSNFFARNDNTDVFKESKKNHRLSIPVTDLTSFFPQSFFRRSKHNTFEGFSIPFEVDRLVRGLGYLQYQKLRRNPLVRFTPAD